jgi:hypothetical protein
MSSCARVATALEVDVTPAAPEPGVNWVDIAQTIGIVVGFVFTIIQLRSAQRLARFEIFWKIGDSHREVWRPVLEKAELARVRREDIDLKHEPLTEPERAFAISLIHHIEGVYRAMREGYYTLSFHEERDIAELFKLPIFDAVWRESRSFLDRHFAHSIEELRQRYARAHGR